VAKAITAYADVKGGIHSTLEKAQRADDAIAATAAWRDLEQKTECPGRSIGREHFGVQYPTVDYMLKDRLFIEAVFRAVDRANKGR
jgi:hypothetical protein